VPVSSCRFPIISTCRRRSARRWVDAESEEFRRLTHGLAEVEGSHDFVVVDTPGSDTFLNRLAHRIADTLITPMNDSFVDFDVLARIDPVSHEIIDHSQYASGVRDARRERRQTDGVIVDWVVVRNRMANISSRNEQKVEGCLRNLSMQLGFRFTDGISERVVFREFFPIGLTALDDFEEHVLGGKPTLSHVAARQEIRQLLHALRLPTDEVGRKRIEARRKYAESIGRPIAMPDIVRS
jgi:chromosome partitioning protein